MKIQVAKSSMPEFEEYVNEIKELWDSRWLTNMVVKHQKLEEELEKYLEVSGVSLFTNGHIAIETAIQALNLTGEVITTPFTFASTAHAIVRNGLVPVFCDINPKDFTMDADKIEALITDKTSAIIPVHFYGSLCDVEAINRIADKHNLKVIYDAAHAFRVTKEGMGAGSFGDISMFNFHATKVFHTVEGGALTFQKKSLYEKLQVLKNFGIKSQEGITDVAGNGKMSEFHAAMGICNLRHLDREIEKCKNVVQRYRKNLSNIKGIRLLEEQAGVNSNYAYFPVIFDGEFPLSRDEVFEILTKNDIIPRKYFYPLTKEFSCYKGLFDDNETPTAKRIAKSVLC